MPEDKVYYDNADLSASLTSTTFFADDEATSGENNTNLPTKNQLDRDFAVHEIHVQIVDDLTRANALLLSEKAIFKLKIGDTDVIKLPLKMCLSAANFATEGTVAAVEIMALHNPANGFKLKNPFVIPANTKFNAYIVVQTALSVATGCEVALVGEHA